MTCRESFLFLDSKQSRNVTLESPNDIPEEVRNKREDLPRFISCPRPAGSGSLALFVAVNVIVFYVSARKVHEKLNLIDTIRTIRFYVLSDAANS